LQKLERLGWHGRNMFTPVVRELESLQHIVPDNNGANEDENGIDQ
jgi:hypothetical protein